MNAEHLGYAAGLFDGEGSVSVYKGCIRMSAGMIDREPLEVLRAVFGGKIYGPRPQKRGAPMFYWQLPGWAAVETQYARIRHLLCPRRREQFTRAFAKPRAAPRVVVTRPPPCGFDRNRVSNAGHVAHYKRGEKACADCAHAAQLYMRKRRGEK